MNPILWCTRTACACGHVATRALTFLCVLSAYACVCVCVGSDNERNFDKEWKRARRKHNQLSCDEAAGHAASDVMTELVGYAAVKQQSLGRDAQVLGQGCFGVVTLRRWQIACSKMQVAVKVPHAASAPWCDSQKELAKDFFLASSLSRRCPVWHEALAATKAWQAESSRRWGPQVTCAWKLAQPRCHRRVACYAGSQELRDSARMPRP